jgi:hypothetical protein
MRRSCWVPITSALRTTVAAVGVLALVGCGSGGGGAAMSLSVAPPTSPDGMPSSSAPAPDTADPTVATAAPRSSVTPKVRATARASVTGRPRTVTPTPRTTRSATATPTAAGTLDMTTTLAAQTTAIRDATSVHLAAAVASAGQRFGVDLNDGTDSDGTLTYSEGSIAIRRVGQELYLSPDDAFFTGHGHPELVAAYHGKWMHIVVADPAYAQIIPLTYLSSWTKLVEGAPATSVKPGGTVDGVATYAISGGTGPKGNTLYVAATGHTLPVATVSTDKVDTITFSNWNTAPQSAQTPGALIDEPGDAIIDVPTFPQATTQAFSTLWPA